MIPFLLWALSPLLVLFIMPMPALAQSEFPRPRGLVNDFAGVIPPAYEKKIRSVTAELLEKTAVPVVVVTMPDIGGAEYNAYANRLYRAWGIGKKGEDRGVLVFITVKERKMRIETGYGVEGVLPDGLVGEIRDRYMVPFLKQDKYGEGILKGTLALSRVLAEDSGVQLTGEMPLEKPGERRSGIAWLPVVLILFFFMVFSRGRRGGWLFFPLFSGGRWGSGTRYGSEGLGGSFGGFGGGFGGFGGGMSGGGGAGGSF
jgi:uncharacterized protein